jgi:hypothetical protein
VHRDASARLADSVFQLLRAIGLAHERSEVSNRDVEWHRAGREHEGNASTDQFVQCGVGHDALQVQINHGNVAALDVSHANGIFDTPGARHHLIAQPTDE